MCHCSFLTDQNILAGLSASASEIGLVFNIRVRAWHSTHGDSPYSYTLSWRHQGQTSTSSKASVNMVMSTILKFYIYSIEPDYRSATFAMLRQ